MVISCRFCVPKKPCRNSNWEYEKAIYELKCLGRCTAHVRMNGFIVSRSLRRLTCWGFKFVAFFWCALECGKYLNETHSWGANKHKYPKATLIAFLGCLFGGLIKTLGNLLRHKFRNVRSEEIFFSRRLVYLLNRFIQNPQKSKP